MWSTTLNSNLAIAAGVQATPIDLSADLVTAGVGSLGGTVVRTHMRISVSSLIADTNPSIFYGVVIYDRSVVGVNVPAVATDFNIDWMIQNFLAPGAAKTAFINATNFLYGEDVDLRSKRKLHEVNDRPFLVLQNSGSLACAVTVFTKMLIALP